jgi:tripartite-type tricarboxylate transporter receptor subunit TctC
MIRRIVEEETIMMAKCIATLLALWMSCGVLFAQSFPGKPIRIIVPTIAGSAPDVRVRQIAPKLSEALGQPVMVDNRPNRESGPGWHRPLFLSMT